MAERSTVEGPPVRPARGEGKKAPRTGRMTVQVRKGSEERAGAEGEATPKKDPQKPEIENTRVGTEARVPPM